MSLNHFGLHARSSWASWVRLSRSRPLLRNVVYGTLVFLAVYTFIYATFPEKAPSLFPGYSDTSDENVSPDIWAARASQVKAAFRHAYRGYQEYAAPADELKPLSNTPINKCLLFILSFYSDFHP